MGGGAPASEHRGTVVEAEATLSRRVAAEAEAGKPTVPHACPRGKGGEEAMNLEKHKLVISNAFSLTMLQHFDAAKVLVRRVSLDEVKREIERAKQSGYEIVSAIGHESTARLVSQLLGFDLPMNRIQVSLDYRTDLLVFQLRTRLPEGKILSEEELKQVEYDFYIVSLEPLQSPPQRG